MTSNEVNDLKHYLDELDNNNDIRSYNATLVSVLMKQRQGESEDFIDRAYGPIKKEHKMNFSVGNNNISWIEVPRIGFKNSLLENYIFEVEGQSYNLNIHDNLVEFCIEKSIFISTEETKEIKYIFEKRLEWLRKIKCL